MQSELRKMREEWQFSIPSHSRPITFASKRHTDRRIKKHTHARIHNPTCVIKFNTTYIINVTFYRQRGDIYLVRRATHVVPKLQYFLSIP